MLADGDDIPDRLRAATHTRARTASRRPSGCRAERREAGTATGPEGESAAAAVETRTLRRSRSRWRSSARRILGRDREPGERARPRRASEASACRSLRERDANAASRRVARARARSQASPAAASSSRAASTTGDERPRARLEPFARRRASSSITAAGSTARPEPAIQQQPCAGSREAAPSRAAPRRRGASRVRDQGPCWSRSDLRGGLVSTSPPRARRLRRAAREGANERVARRLGAAGLQVSIGSADREDSERMPAAGPSGVGGGPGAHSRRSTGAVTGTRRPCGRCRRARAPAP